MSASFGDALPQYIHGLFNELCSFVFLQETTVNLEEESLPWNTDALTVRHCETVSLTLSQKVALTPLRSLTIENVDTLELVDTTVQPYLFNNPPLIEFRNIGKIPRIPSHTFTSASEIKVTCVHLET